MDITNETHIITVITIITITKAHIKSIIAITDTTKNNLILFYMTDRLINADNSHTTGIPFSSTVNPATTNWRVLPEPVSNVAAAAGVVPMKGGLKRRINKISRKYKMRHSRKASRRTKRRLRAKYSRHRRGGSRRSMARGVAMGMAKGRALGLQGGMLPPPSCKATGMCGGQHPRLHMRGGWAQYNLNKPADIGYSSGNIALSAKDSALANPVPATRYDNAIDNLNHNAPNAYGNSGSGSGFASKGWF